MEGKEASLGHSLCPHDLGFTAHRLQLQLMLIIPSTMEERAKEGPLGISRQGDVEVSKVLEEQELEYQY